MSLYSKYRPQNFANLVGQEHIRITLLHEIQKGTVSHAYLFAGPRGTGKTSTARLIAKALNCEKKNAEGEPCDACNLCTTIKEGGLIDVIEVDAASNRGIDEIRDLKEKIKFAPTLAKSKTYIIDEVHMLTKEAFNALLKTLEEPPENVYFILCTTEVHKIPETIISRCQRFDFKRIDMKTIMTRLSYIAQMEKIEAEEQAIDLIARHVEGGLRDAIGLFEQMAISGKLLADHVRVHLGITGHETITALLDVLEKKETAKALHLINEVHHEGYDLTAFVREVLECLRERLIAGVLKTGPGSPLWLGMIERFEEARDMLRNTVIPQLPLEIAVIKICGTTGTSPLMESVKEEKKEEVKNEVPAARIKAKVEDAIETAQAQKGEVETAQTLKQEIEMEAYKGDGKVVKLWQRVLENIQPPSLRRSMAEAKIAGEKDETLTLLFNSKFHMEKVNNAESKTKIESAVNKLVGKSFKVICQLDASLQIEVPAVRETKQPQVPTRVATGGRDQKAQAKLAKKSQDVAAEAMEIFGEEF
ncbi:MAG: DNA polymerase III subunit gamma/tau [Patescibacteria group bacterium]